MSAQKLLYIISQAPYSNSAGQEALDAILIGASFDQHVSVLFLHDGVFQLKSHQQDNSHEQNNSHQNDGRTENTLKQFTKTYRALPDFGVQDMYVLSSSLDARGIQINELIIAPSLLDESSASELIAQQFRVFTF